MQSNTNVSEIQGLNVSDLTTQFGSPLYVYDGAKIVSQLQTLQNTFYGMKVKIKFAAKALTNISVLRLLKKHGAGVDVVSINEVKIALQAGFLPSDIMFTPSGVAFEEIVEAVDLKLNINLDNLPVLEKFGKKYGSSYPCGLRLNPSIMAGGNIKISTGHSNSKFGISVLQMDTIKELILKYNITIQGLHIHTGSELKDVDVFMKMSDILFDLAKDFPALKFLDFGGGFKVAYKPNDVVTNMKELSERLSKSFQDFNTKNEKGLELWIEPGKFLVSESGHLLVKTNVVKETPTVTFVGVDSGLNHLIRPMMYDSYHEIVNTSNPAGELKTYTIVGNICETDTLGADRQLNEVREGDILDIKNAGAYGYSMASNYNSRFRPAEVLIWDGKANLIRKRDTMEDLIRNQIEIDL